MPPTSPESQTLIALLKDYGLSGEQVELIQSKFTPLHLKKDEVFSQSGKVCNSIGILLNGLLYAAYEADNTDDEFVSRFFYLPQNLIVTSFESFQNGKPSNESITAIEDSHLVCISRTGLYKLYQTIPEMNRIGRELAEQSYIQALQRIHNLQALNVDQRIDAFIKDHSSLFNRAKQSQLVSYLRVHRNAISEYFKKMKSKNFAGYPASEKKPTQ
jgi:CRP/FNR family transcriptional regulator, anaerobic regulatory protein